MRLDTFEDLRTFLHDSVSFNGHSVALRSRKIFTEQHLDRLTYELVFHADPALRQRIRWLLSHLSADCRIYPASIQSLYEARARDELRGFTVPAIHLPALTYDLACAVFRTASRLRVGSFIFALTRADLETTGQSFEEYATVILAAAIHEHWYGPVFLMADRLQADAHRFAAHRAGEIAALKRLLEQAIQAGMYNINLDFSALADWHPLTPAKPLAFNYSHTAELTAYIRQIEPHGITVCVGAEIGEVSGRNSTEENLRAFMSGYQKVFADWRYGAKGISKLAIQTRALATGIPLSDGRIVATHLDLATLRHLSRIAHGEYGLAGVVQHGAAELPWAEFDRFPATHTIELHLRSEVQEVILEGLHIHSTLQDEMDRFLKREYAAEWPPDMTEAHFLHRMRERAWKAFKQPLWDLPLAVRAALTAELEAMLSVVFEKCGVTKTRAWIGDRVVPRTSGVGGLGSGVGD